jgi:hypothetical protein
MSNLEHALRYAARGMSIVPIHHVVGGESGTCNCGAQDCGSPGKHPRIYWQNYAQARPTREEIVGWWTRWPEANIGFVTGAISGMVVVDIDGEKGLRSLEGLGLDPLLADTPVVRTGSGGYHIYFIYPEGGASFGTSAGRLPGVDVRADGGIAVLPPSMHASGGRYTWIHGLSLDDLELADLREWGSLLAVLSGEAPKATRRRWFEDALEGVTEGARDDTAARLAGRYIGIGLTDGEVFTFLELWNERNIPPLDPQDLRRVVRSIRRKHSQTIGEGVDRKEIMEDVSRLMGLSLVDVRRITGNPATYILDFEEGRVSITSTTILSPAGLQEAVAEGTRRVIRKLSNRSEPSHEVLAQRILLAAQDDDIGEEATDEGELLALIQEYIDSRGRVVRVDAVVDFPQTEPCVFDGRLWIPLTHLLRYLKISWSMHISRRDLAHRLRQSGAIQRDFYIGSSKLSRWGVEPGRIDWEEDDGNGRIPSLWSSGDGQDDLRRS